MLITLPDVRSESLEIGIYNYSKIKQAYTANVSKTMTESEGIKEVVKQAAVHVATAAMMAFKETGTEPQQTHIVSHMEPQRQRNSQLVLEKPSFNWDTQGRYI